MSVAAAYRERASRMLAWTTKLNLAIALRDTWEFLDPVAYPEGSAARAAKALELVTRLYVVAFSLIRAPLTLLLVSPTSVVF